MHDIVLNRSCKADGTILGRIKDTLTNYGLSVDVLAFISLIILTNTHLFTGNAINFFVFYPSALSSGQWWRIITHPFVHLTWYHFLLDAGAFFILYRELFSNRISKRIFYVLTCGSISLITAIITSPEIETLGLSGLSGIAHGLMAISALEMMQRKKDYRFGLTCLMIVVSKSIYEVINGDVLFSFLHFGMCGTPIAACHAGGVLGGIFAYYTGKIPGRISPAERAI
jgi:rhomboid family GlyGly-CTERM serine protease